MHEGLSALFIQFYRYYTHLIPTHPCNYTDLNQSIAKLPYPLTLNTCSEEVNLYPGLPVDQHEADRRLEDIIYVLISLTYCEI